MVTRFRNTTPNYKLLVWAVASVLVALKCVLLPWCSWTDADAVSRHLLTLDMMADPHIITNGNWPSLYFYFQAAMLSILPASWSPLVLQILLSSGAMLALFYAFKPWTSERSAFWTAVVFAFCPLVFRLSLMNMAETGYLFFLLAGAALVSAAVKMQKNLLLFSGALFISIATGFRYEAILVSALFVVFFVWKKQWIQALMLALGSGLFLAYWAYSNYLIWQNPAKSLSWAAQAIANNEISSTETLFRRLGWFPMSLLLCLGPAAWYYIIRSRSTLAAVWKSNTWVCIMPASFLLLSMSMCIAGSLLLQHRFSLTSLLLLLPLLALILERLTAKQIATWVVVALACTYAYPTKGLRPVPYWHHDMVEHMSAKAREYANTHPAFIMEFYDWEASYYMLHEVNLRSKDVLFIQGEKGREFGGTIAEFVFEHPEGIVFVNAENVQLNQWIQEALAMHHKSTFLIHSEAKFNLIGYK